MGRLSLKETRQKEIILAFYTVAKKTGLENASIAKVADYMDINPSLIVHYFKTREALFAGLIEFILQQYSQIYKINGQAYTRTSEVKKLIDNLFSRKWDNLFDDSVFYSCYALTYRDKNIRSAFRLLHDSLRKLLIDALKKANKNGVINIKSEKETAEIIFALMEGAYYYLGMVDSRTDYTRKLATLKKQALALLGMG